MKACFVFPPYTSAVKSVVGVSSPLLGLAYFDVLGWLRNEQFTFIKSGVDAVTNYFEGR